MFIYLFIYVIQENGQHTNVKTNYAERNSKCISDWRGVEITTEEEEWKEITKKQGHVKKKYIKRKSQFVQSMLRFPWIKNCKKKKNIILTMALLSSSVFAWFTQTAETHTHTRSWRHVSVFHVSHVS